MSKRKKNRTYLKCRVKIDPTDYKAENWYSDATELIQELYRENWRLFVGFLASTSPRNSVKKNWRLADKLLQSYLLRNKYPEKWFRALSNLMPAHLVNVIRTLRGSPIKGPKVSRFYKNLIGDLSVVTIDIWICRAYGIEHKSLTKTVYEKLEKKIIDDANKAGIAPANWQAVLWYAIRRMSGFRPKSFVSVYRSIFCEMPCFAFMNED